MAITTRSTVPLTHVVLDPGAHLRTDEGRPQPLHGGDRHAGAGNAERQPRLAAGIIEIAREREAEFHIAELALLDVDALLVGIDAQAQQEAIEDERLVDRRGRRRQHHRAAVTFEAPGAAGLARRVELRERA